MGAATVLDVAAVVTTAAAFTPQARSYAERWRSGWWDNRAPAAWASATGPAPWP
ncbi:hypothetical protein [Nocardia farcinica]|uniref:hypothetical protein n=1 Tax=Nocardia farcinica TaxID=37329 RepID=UPI00245534F9|nr:hypothetical protein [Nocardia farcinica]